MRLLIVHADDDLSAFCGVGSWDRVIDLGFAGPGAYQRLSREFGCPVEPAGKLNHRQFRDLRQALGGAVGLLVDDYGLDWWDLISLEFHRQFEEIARIREVAAEIDAHDEVCITRAGFHSKALSSLLNRPMRCLSNGPGGIGRLRHYRAMLWKFSLAQLLQIVSDKYDTGYQLRRLITKRGRISNQPVVLLPSAYVNVTRTELHYAEMLPDARFLLVTTRMSGEVASLPANVSSAKLESYARRDQTRREYDRLLACWEQLTPRLMADPILSVALRSGALDSFPKLLCDGLMIRDAWAQVFEREPIRAVLCADEANLATRIPLLIARNRGLPAISCHHGALDGRYHFRQRPDGVFLVKGRMERDYLRRSGLSDSALETGAPACAAWAAESFARGSCIVFFSDAYEVSGARGPEFYRELLPRLVKLANSTERQLVIKLHPAESLQERKRLARKLLPDSEFEKILFISGPLTDDLLQNTAAAITVVSTTAVECAVRGVPAFICAWLDYSNYGYAEQFIKFGAAIGLNSVEDIARIPAMVREWTPPAPGDFVQPITSERLERLFSAQEEALEAAV